MEIYIKPEEIWDFFYNRTEPIEAPIIIAEDKKSGAVICLDSEEGCPYLAAFIGDNIYAREDIISRIDCEYMVRELIDELSIPEFEDDCSDYGEYEEGYTEEEIEEREAELIDVVWDLLSVAFEVDFTSDLDIYIVTDEILQYLTSTYGMPIRRPVVMIDEFGQEYCEEYPYDCADSIYE